jgi:heptosyltransferase-1
MKRILLVRLSSLGDVLHTFPAATDIRRALPDAILDWAVEEAYVPIVRMHPGVTRAIPFALRRWRREWYRARAWRELAAFRARLTERAYDAILDTQGLLKSALVAKLARGPVYGFAPGTAHERLATRFYDVRYPFAPSDHKIERYRAVAARALGYTAGTTVDYGVVAPPAPAFAPRTSYCVLLHSTARAAKLWSEAGWIAVARALESRGVVGVLPWGEADERARSDRIAATLTRALVPPRMSVEEAAGLVGHADAVIGVDTGLMHLAAAFRVPVVGIFCDSEPLDAQPLGGGPTAHRGGVGTPPAAAQVLEALREVAPALGKT